jgi:hypothetical protein
MESISAGGCGQQPIAIAERERIARVGRQVGITLD